QGQAIVRGMGLPDDAAKEIGGDGPSEEDKARMGAQQEAPQTPGQDGGKPGSAHHNKVDQKQSEPKKPAEQTEEQIKKAQDLLSKPVVIDLKDVEDQVDLILNNCGAGAPGSPGFQLGNTCARGGGGGGD